MSDELEQQGGTQEGIDSMDRMDRKESTPHTSIMSRRAFLAMALLAACKAAQDPLSQATAEQEQVKQNKQSPEAPPATRSDPNRPEFLDEDNVPLHGLALLLANNDKADKYIFNAITGNKDFAKTFGIQKGYPLKFDDGRTFTMPYHAFIFKPFDERSNVHLPKRLGKATNHINMASFFRNVSKYKADTPKDIAAIKVIITTSYDLSFGIQLDPAHIEIIPDQKGRIKSIKYTAPNARQLSATTTIATKTRDNKKNPEDHDILSTTEKRYALVDENNELYFPPSAMADQGIALPHSSIVKKETFTYSKQFESQGKTIALKFEIPIDSILEEQKALFEQKRPQTFNVDEETITINPGWYIRKNDPFVKGLAEYITKSFTTKREKMQVILDFIHSYNYVPDSYGEAPRSPLLSLICQGGDCEDSSILAVALAEAIGIDCIFIHFDGHMNAGCDIGEEGTAMKWGDNNYEWMETTGGNEGVTTLTRFQDQRGKIVKTEKEVRAWRIGEKPPYHGEPQFVSKTNSQQLTRIK